MQSQLYPPSTWPEIYVTVESRQDSYEMARYFENWPGTTATSMSRLLNLGLITVPVPPIIEFAQWIAIQPNVGYVCSTESPVKLADPEPQPARPSSQVRRMTRTRREFKINPSYVPSIAILDTGIDNTHPDFPVIGSDNLLNFTDSETILDLVGHGSHVAGIAVGNGEASSQRIIGQAPGAELFIAKVLDDEGAGTVESVLSGIAWAYEMGVDIINLSLGSPLESPVLDALAMACKSVSESGILVCAAAGNEGDYPGPIDNYTRTVASPAIAPGVIAVGAVDNKGDLVDFSSRGDPEHSFYKGKPDCVAPGTGIIAAKSTFSESDYGISKPSNFYVGLDGTSMASPNVAGALAILTSLLVEKGLQVKDARRMAKDALITTSTPVKIGEPLSGEKHNDRNRRPGRECRPHEAGSGLINVSQAIKHLRL